MQDQLKTYKSLDAYNAIVDGWVQVFLIPSSTNFLSICSSEAFSIAMEKL